MPHPVSRSVRASRARSLGGLAEPLAQVEGLFVPIRSLGAQPQGQRPIAGDVRPPIALAQQPWLGGCAELIEICDGFAQVRCEHAADLLGSVAGARLRPPRDLLVLGGTRRFRQGLVRAVADQPVPEHELRLAREARRIVREHQLLDAESSERVADARLVSTRECRDRAGPEHPADDRRVLQDLFLVEGQRVETRRDQTLDRTRYLDVADRAGELPPGARHRTKQAVVDQLANDLLDVERVALASVGDHPRELGLDVDRQEVGEHRRALIRRQRVEVDRRRVALAAAPGRPDVEQLGPRERHDQDRALREVREMIDEIEQPGVGPMDVLEREDQREASRHPFQEPTPRVEQIVAREGHGVAGADERQHLRRDRIVAEQLGDRLLDLLDGDLVGVVLQDLALRLDRVGER